MGKNVWGRAPQPLQLTVDAAFAKHCHSLARRTESPTEPTEVLFVLETCTDMKCGNE